MKDIIIKNRLTVSIVYFFIIHICNVVGQVTTLSQVVSNAEIKAQILRSDAEERAKANAEYLRLHPVEATNALSQRQLELLDLTATQSGVSNFFSQYHSPEELKDFTNTIQYYLTNVAAQSSYFFHVHGMTESEYVSNAARYMHKPAPWPDTPEKCSTLKFCADVLRSALDTNRIETACVQTTNRPGAVLAIRYISKVAISNLNEFATYLINPRLDVYGNFGDIAIGKVNEEKAYFLFWSQDGPVRQLDKRTIDGRIIVGARFDKNGKLLEFRLNSPDSKGVLKREIELMFNNDGTLHSFWERPAETKP